MAMATLAVACTHEEPRGSEAAADVSRRPMTFTAAGPQPMAGPTPTRVADNSGDGAGSTWTDGDRIRIVATSLSDGNTASTLCTLRADGSVAGYTRQMYWTTTGLYRITAWYANISDNRTTDSAIDLSDQSRGLAYVLKADTTVAYAFSNSRNGDIQLSFAHQLARVRVRLTSNAGGAIPTANADVWIRNCHTLCTISDGDVIPAGSASNNIRMRRPQEPDGCFEANVMPDAGETSRRAYALAVEVDGKPTAVHLAQPVAFARGKTYTITIRME